MRPALLIASVALAFTATARCFPQQTVPTGKQELEDVVVKLYKQIVLRKPLGLPTGKKLQAIRSFFSRDLIERIRATRECEKDYFLQHPDAPTQPLKAPFAWMESGLFS